MAMLFGGFALPSRFDPVSWHIHEMLFGFVMAAVAGFLLTAIPNWTGRLPVKGAPLILLATLWLIGRLSCLTSAWMTLPLAIAADLAFTLYLLLVAGREIVAAKHWRNLPMTAPVTVLGAANLLMHLEAGPFPALSGLGWRLGLVATLILISVIGGRIIPSFTRNWQMKRNESPLPAPAGGIDKLALGTMHPAMLAWAFAPDSRIVGVLLIAAGAIQAIRLARWNGWRTAAEPLLLILHVGYGWMAAGVILLGLPALTSAVPLPAAVHALTAGAIGVMIAAVMTRASRGHTGNPLSADRATVIFYALINGAALLRVAAGLDLLPRLLIGLSAAAWIAAFAIFILRYAPMLTRRRTH
jgi:uncharacterized protein involved in response to NO